MIIAVASQNFSTVSPHAGKARRFILFAVEQGGEPAEVGRVELPAGMTIHDFREDGPHPLDQAQVVLSASAGSGFIAKLAQRGIVVAVTSETVPAEAVRRFLVDGPGPESGGEICGCGGHHNHD